MEPLLTNQVTWTQTNLQPLYSGLSLISSRQLYVTEKAHFKLDAKNNKKFIESLPPEMRQIEENYDLSAAFLIYSRQLAPLHVTSFKGKKTYKVITFFTDEILKDNRLNEIEINSLKIQLNAMKRIVFLLREKQTGHIQYIAVHKEKSFLKLSGKICGLGLAKFNETGQWIRKKSKEIKSSSIEKKIPTGFKIDYLSHAKLLPINDTLYSKFQEKFEQIFAMKAPKIRFNILYQPIPAENENSEDYF